MALRTYTWNSTYDGNEKNWSDSGNWTGVGSGYPGDGGGDDIATIPNGMNRCKLNVAGVVIKDLEISGNVAGWDLLLET